MTPLRVQKGTTPKELDDRGRARGNKKKSIACILYIISNSC